MQKFQEVPAGDFVAVGLVIPNNPDKFLLAFGSGGTRRRNLPTGWQFAVLEPQGDKLFAVFYIPPECSNFMTKQLEVVRSEIKAALK